MNWKERFKAIGKTAFPTIATGLFGPAGATVVAMLTPALFGDDQKRSPEEIADYILEHQSPELLLKLRELEGQIKRDLRQLDIDVFALEVENQKSARDMYAKTRSIMVPILAVTIVAGFFGLAALFTWAVLVADKAIPESTQLGMLISAVMASLYAVINFFFGSSLGSKEKTGMLGTGVNN